MPFLRIAMTSAVVSLALACSEPPADPGEAPPDFNAVSAATVCLPNGTVHDPNPVGKCTERTSTCQYSDPLYADDSDHRNWSDNEWKKQCSGVDWMTGVSTTSQKRPSFFHCELSPYTTSSGASAEIDRGKNNNVYPSSYNTRSPVSQYKVNGVTADWDPGYERAECLNTYEFISGFSFRKGAQSDTNQIDHIRCARFSGVTLSANTNCRPVLFPDDALPQTSNRETTSTGEWDPAPNLMLECATGSHMVGISRSAANIHGILCCDGGPTFTPTTSATCCNSTT